MDPAFPQNEDNFDVTAQLPPMWYDLPNDAASLPEWSALTAQTILSDYRAVYPTLTAGMDPQAMQFFSDPNVDNTKELAEYLYTLASSIMSPDVLITAISMVDTTPEYSAILECSIINAEAGIPFTEEYLLQKLVETAPPSGIAVETAIIDLPIGRAARIHRTETTKTGMFSKVYTESVDYHIKPTGLTSRGIYAKVSWPTQFPDQSNDQQLQNAELAVSTLKVEL